MGEAAKAYDYLKTNAYGRRYLDNYLTEAEQDELHNMLYDRDSEDQWKSVYFNTYPIEEGGLTIRGYEKIYGVDEHYGDECSVQEYESKTITAGDNVYEGVDLTSCISYYKDLEDKNENQVVDEKDKVYEIQISDTEKLIVTYISFEIDDEQTMIKRMFIKGYMLTK